MFTMKKAILAMVAILAAAPLSAQFANQQAPFQVSVNQLALRGEETLRFNYAPNPQSTWCVILTPDGGTGPTEARCSGISGGEITVTNERRNDGSWRFNAGAIWAVGYVPYFGQLRFTEFAVPITVLSLDSTPNHLTNVEGAIRPRVTIPLNGMVAMDVTSPSDSRPAFSDLTATVLQINGTSRRVQVDVAPNFRAGFSIPVPPNAQVGNRIVVAGVGAYDVGAVAYKWLYGSQYFVGSPTGQPPVANACAATFLPPAAIRIAGTNRTRPSRGPDGVFEIPTVRRQDGQGFETVNFDFEFAYPSGTLLRLGTATLTFTYWDNLNDVRPYGENQIVEGTTPRNPAARGLSVRALPNPVGSMNSMRFVADVQSGPGNCTRVDSGAIPFRIVETQ